MRAAWVTVASGLKLSIQIQTPLFWQLVGIARACAEDGVDDRAVRVVNYAQRIVGGCGSDVGGRGDLVPLSNGILEPLTSSFREPASVSVTPAVGTALHRAAAASTMAVACWLLMLLFSGP